MEKPWVVVTFRMPEELRDQLTSVCNKNNKRQSMILRALVQGYLTKKFIITSYTEKVDLTLP